MQRKTYCPLHSDFKSFYQSQSGSGFSDIEVFRGAPYQRGYGIGSLFARFALPVFKYLGKKVLRTGLSVGQDILDKKNLKESIKTRGKEGLKSVGRDAIKKANTILNQTGTGIKRKRKAYKTTSKRRKKDIFN